MRRAIPSLPSVSIAEQKAKRRQVLEAVQQRRKVIYQRYCEKARRTLALPED